MADGDITDIAELEALYGKPGKASLIKVADHLTPLYAKWIAASRFCVIATVGPEGTDASPRGDDGPVVQVADEKTLLMPDWRGNNRIDTLRNVVRDGRLSLMFMVPGSNNVIRVNGIGRVTANPDVLARFDHKGRTPRSVIVMTIAEVYSQCARALMRSDLWGAPPDISLPTIGELLAEAEAGFDGKAYDAAWHDRAAGTMW